MYDYDRGGWVQMGPPEGVQVLSLDDPAELHNAIAEAVGEPAIYRKPRDGRRA
jgi:hypothetical protein